jgi:hypothetical protein
LSFSAASEALSSTVESRAARLKVMPYTEQLRFRFAGAEGDTHFMMLLAG